MKKRIIMIAVAAILALFTFNSCSTSSHCPAYSQADVEQAGDNA